MKCESEWTLRFPEVNMDEPFEVRPVEMTFKEERRKLDHCRLELPWQVGEEMKPHTRYDDGELRYEQRVELALDGETVQVLLFRPDNVEFTTETTHIELVDLQKVLDEGVVDKQWDKVKLRDAYEYAFEKCPRTDLFTDIRFTIPEDLQGYGQAGLVWGDGEQFRIKELDRYRDEWNDFANFGNVAKVEASDTKKLVDSFYAANFDKISPLKAVWQLNKKYRLQTWVDREGVLWVGSPETHGSQYIAAQDDNRVWFFSDANISHPRDPVHSVVVEGKWVDDPGVALDADISSWFSSSDEAGYGDVRATGIASRTDIDSGQSFTVKSTQAKRDAVAHVADFALREEMKKQHSGTVTIDPTLSDDPNSIGDAVVGDFLHVVPDDRHFDNPTASSGRIGETPIEIKRDTCANFVHNEVYVITGITHTVRPEEGWMATFDVGLYPEVPIESFTRYFDPRSGEMMTEEEVYDGSWTEDDT